MSPDRPEPPPEPQDEPPLVTDTAHEEYASLGIPLSSLEPLFTHVPLEATATPAITLDLATLLSEHRDAVLERYGWDLTDSNIDLPGRLYHLDARHLLSLSPDALAKCWYMSSFALATDEFFRGRCSLPARGLPPESEWSPALRVLGKVAGSMWRWGCGGQKDWNGLVFAYNALRKFDFGVPGFTVTFDHATGANECGYSQHARVYLDGSLGYLVHYRGRHVLTIGWSISGSGDVLLTQIQMPTPKGNRWTYRLPRPLLEHVLDRLAIAFPDHPLCLVGGQALADRIDAHYETVRARARREATETGEPVVLHGPTEEVKARIAYSYDRPLEGYLRTDVLQLGGLPFTRLKPAKQSIPTVSVSKASQGQAAAA